MGLEIARAERKYALEMLEEFGFLGRKPVATHGELLSNPSLYRKLIGKLVYLTVSKPGICFVVNKLSQYLAAPRDPHLFADNRILKYLKNDPDQGIFYSAKSSLTLRAFADANWETCPDTRRSISGSCIFIGDSLVS